MDVHPTKNGINRYWSIAISELSGNGLQWPFQIVMLPWLHTLHTLHTSKFFVPLDKTYTCLSIFCQAASKPGPYSFRYDRQASCMLASVIGSQYTTWPGPDSTFASPERRAQSTITWGWCKRNRYPVHKASFMGTEVGTDFQWAWDMWDLFQACTLMTSMTLMTLMYTLVI